MCLMFTCRKKSNKRNYVVGLVGFVFIFAILLVAFAFFIPVNNNRVVALSVEEELENETDNILSDIDFSGLESVYDKLDYEYDLFNGQGFKDYLKSVIKGTETISFDQMINIFFSNIKQDLKNIIYPIIVVFAVVLLCNIFSQFKSGNISGISEVIYFVCFSIVVTILATLLKNVINESRSCINNIKIQMDSIFPILLSLLTSVGGVVTVKTFSPILLILTSVVFKVFVNILIPLFSLSLILSVVGNLSESNKFDKMNGFVKSFFKWIIGIVFTVYMAVFSIKGLTAGVSDGLSIKATKYAIKNYIPMLGGYISEGFEFIKAGSMIVKNATGLLGIVLLFATIFSPIILVGLVELVLKLLAGVVEVVGDKKSSSLIYSIASSLRLLVVVLVGISLMYFFTIFILLCSASNFI